MLTIITGPFGIGKSTQLLELLKTLKENKVETSGVICPAVFEEDQKTGIDALLLPNEERLHLARRFSGDDIERDTMWDFSQDAFAAINQHFDTIKAPILIIDELGPQEFFFKRGFVSAMKILDEGSYEEALVVIRPTLLAEAEKRWSPHRIVDVSNGPKLNTLFN